jgi:chromosome segregation ATPase
LDAQVEQLSESNAEFAAMWEAQQRGAEAVGLDLNSLLGGLTRVVDLQHEVVELEESNAALEQSGELSRQRLSSMEVDIEDYEGSVSAAQQDADDRATQVEQLVAQIEALESTNEELSAIGEHSSDRIGSLESELEDFEAEGVATEESVRVHKEEIELLQEQIARLQSGESAEFVEGAGYSESSVEEYELPGPVAERLAAEGGVAEDLDDGASGIPAGHDPEDYEVDDRPSWES